MQSIITSNPIYQHSGETEKLPAIAQQASVNEDQEQRRRQLDGTGEQRKKLIAKEVSNLVDQFAGRVQLKSTPYTEPKQPILQQAQESATSLFSSALEAGKSLLNTATATAGAVAGAVAGGVQSVANTTLDTASSALGTASAVSHDAAVKANEVAHLAANQASSLANTAATQASSLANTAANQASTIAHKVVDTTSSAAGAVTQKAKELTNAASDKAYELADNISHFTTLVGVLAEEENERARRLVSGDEALAAANAFKVSELIRGLGDSFYKQQPNLLYTTKVLEEAERRWRLNSAGSELAERNAHKEGKLVKKNLQNFMPRYQWARTFITGLEEKERTRRLTSPSEAYAIQNALELAFIIRELGLGFYRQEGTFSRTHAGYATTLLEENERRDRIRTHNLLHANDSHSLLSDVVANNVEKFSYTTRNAAKFANEFASLLGNATMKMASQFSSLTKDFAGAATERVKTVAGDLKSFTSSMYIIALEEKERARRLSDSDEITAINNAWFQSQLIRDLSALYRPSSLARYPLGLIEESERRWRMSSITPSASRKIAGLVLANSQKFELAMQRAADAERARADAISHSRLNPRAPAFVPHQAFAPKVEPAPIAPASVASSAQL